jgi:hypothetical protein
MKMDFLYRPYVGKRPITTIWYKTREEAEYSAKVFNPNQPFTIISKDLNTLVRKRHKTELRGLI